jgi:hypothetical protein
VSARIIGRAAELMPSLRLFSAAIDTERTAQGIELEKLLSGACRHTLAAASRRGASGRELAYFVAGIALADHAPVSAEHVI